MRRGSIAAQPLAIGVLVCGITSGLLALGSGLSVVDALKLTEADVTQAVAWARRGTWAARRVTTRPRSAPPLRVVLDTDVLVSALLFPSGGLGRLRIAWQAGVFIPLASTCGAEHLRAHPAPHARIGGGPSTPPQPASTRAK